MEARHAMPGFPCLTRTPHTLQDAMAFPMYSHTFGLLKGAIC